MQILSGLLLALSCFGLFLVFSSAIAAILFGPGRGPKFIRAAAWLYSRPRSVFEWFGFGITVAIAFATQWTVMQAISTDAATFGPLGVGILQVEFAVAGGWIMYLVYLYGLRRS